MNPTEGQINLKITNNTSFSQQVDILGVIPNQNSANNANLFYQFDLTGQVYAGITQAKIRISNTSNPSIITYTKAIVTQSIQGIVEVLNTLNQGIFSYSGNVIYVSSDYYTYYSLQIT